ncbi:molybdate ABC transporter substrate-binding protein [Hwanghaeella grinnelliae]|uniref:Molybdate ABC transporter substrate-binding protein n=1 Tax=Hwanghaeella grinnelliae TaxID=2500179 RepID=A0A437QHM7_9PROT|nr:molybdate ABC transporter substrate-binding protein [Hwanghaeella grinnelliae]RVU34041.1 molybdate ABC transporter substrate-binding protein [Hwanghaeella grinnelliae]
MRRLTGLLLSGLLGCAVLVGQIASSGQSARAGDIYLMAAASLQPVLSEFILGYGGEIDGNRILTIYASSGTLARQIAQGSPADLYISANPRWAAWLIEENGIPADRTVDLLSSSLVLVVPAEAKATVTLKDFAESGRLMIGDPAHVPAGQYAKQALETLKIWDKLSPRLVFGANVRMAVAFAERGEVDGAIVYRSDAVASTKLRIAEEISPGLYDPVVYRSVLLSEKAQGLLNALQTGDAAAMFRRYGFEPLSARQ